MRVSTVGIPLLCIIGSTSSFFVGLKICQNLKFSSLHSTVNENTQTDKAIFRNLVGQQFAHPLDKRTTALLSNIPFIERITRFVLGEDDISVFSCNQSDVVHFVTF